MGCAKNVDKRVPGTSSWVLAGLCLLLSSAAAPADALTLISPDSPLPKVIADEGSVCRNAAADLCHYLSRVTGREIVPGEDDPGARVVVHVGPDAFVLKHAPEVKDLYADGFLLKHVPVADRHHILLGGILRYSSRWAVEDFLHRFAGVRWLYPGDSKYGEMVPVRPTIAIPDGLNEKHEPDYVSRAVSNMHFLAEGTAALRASGVSGQGREVCP